MTIAGGQPHDILQNHKEPCATYMKGLCSKGDSLFTCNSQANPQAVGWATQYSPISIVPAQSQNPGIYIAKEIQQVHIRAVTEKTPVANMDTVTVRGCKEKPCPQR
jgi:hypothetical protein